MKNILIRPCFAILLGAWLFVSCEKDSPIYYDGLTGISFQSASVFSDNLSSGNPQYPDDPTALNFKKEFFFKYDTVENSYRVLKLPVVVLGYTTDFDRPVKVEIDTSSTLDISKCEIDTLFSFVPAGKTQALINIKMMRPDVTDKDIKKLVIRLVPNEYFSYVNGDGEYFSCTLSNENFKPQYWDYPNNAGVILTEYMGIYSNNKFEFMHKVLDAYEEVTLAYDKMDMETGNVPLIKKYPYRQYATLEGFRALGQRYGTEGQDIQQLLLKAYKVYVEGGVWEKITGYNAFNDETTYEIIRIEANGPIYDENTGKEIQFRY